MYNTTRADNLPYITISGKLLKFSNSFSAGCVKNTRLVLILLTQGEIGVWKPVEIYDYIHWKVHFQCKKCPIPILFTESNIFKMVFVSNRSWSCWQYSSHLKNLVINNCLWGKTSFDPFFDAKNANYCWLVAPDKWLSVAQNFGQYKLGKESQICASFKLPFACRYNIDGIIQFLYVTSVA